MLRISLLEVLDQAVTIRLEGQVRGPWVDELRRSCEQLLARGSELRLDLSDVSCIDMDGVALCRRLRDRKVGILHCSPFVAEQLYLFKQAREMGIHAWNSDPAALVLERFETEQVCRAIAALPEDYRIVSALYFMEEFSYQEIAETVGCPVGTVRSRLHRGRRMLQKAPWHIAAQQGIVADLRTSGE